MTLPTGETLSTGVIEMKSWWKIDCSYPANDAEALIGQKLTAEKNLHVGDVLKFNGGEFSISGILSSGGDEDNQLLVNLAAIQNDARKRFGTQSGCQSRFI